MTDTVKLIHMTLASEDPAAVAGFYNEVLGARFESFDAYGATLYRGQLGGISTVICPNDIAEVDARRARHQLKFAVQDVEHTVTLARGISGGVHTAPFDKDGVKLAVLCDPDDNLIEIEQML